MGDPPADADVTLKPPSPMERRGQIEVDTFCVGCHYNLHGQAVAVDERLNLPVCRCPECGRFHPAGTGVTASNVWVRRMATILLAGWVGIVLVAALAACFLMGLLSVGSVEAYRYNGYATPDGREAEYRTQPGQSNGVTWYVTGTNTPVPSVLYVWKLRRILRDTSTLANAAGMSPYELDEALGPGPEPACWISAGSLALGALVGGLCVTLLWHWPRGRYARCALLPVVPALFMAVVYLDNQTFLLIRGAAIGRTGVQCALQSIGILIGLKIGRPIARALVRVVIPPKPRQALAFLWRVDGWNLPV